MLQFLGESWLLEPSLSNSTPRGTRDARDGLRHVVFLMSGPTATSLVGQIGLNVGHGTRYLVLVLVVL